MVAARTTSSIECSFESGASPSQMSLDCTCTSWIIYSSTNCRARPTLGACDPAVDTLIRSNCDWPRIDGRFGSCCRGWLPVGTPALCGSPCPAKVADSAPNCTYQPASEADKGSLRRSAQDLCRIGRSESCEVICRWCSTGAALTVPDPLKLVQ